MDTLLTAVAVLAISAVLFLVFRKIVLWYFRIGDVINRLDGMIVELKKLTEKG